MNSRKKLKRIEDAGLARFLTFSCYQNQFLLSDIRTRDWIVEAIKKQHVEQRFSLLAYVIMLNHVHLLLVPSPDVPVSSILKRLKQSVSRKEIAWLREHQLHRLEALLVTSATGKPNYHLWQRGGGHDVNIRTAEGIHQKITYIHQNPVRAGLVEKSAHWKWSSAAAWENGSDEPLVIDREKVPRLVQ